MGDQKLPRVLLRFGRHVKPLVPATLALMYM
jgi:hypothetical protein